MIIFLVLILMAYLVATLVEKNLERCQTLNNMKQPTLKTDLTIATPVTRHLSRNDF